MNNTPNPKSGSVYDERVGDEDLIHWGVKGMQWGVRKERASRSEKRALGDAHKKVTQSLTIEPEEAAAYIKLATAHADKYGESRQTAEIKRYAAKPTKEEVAYVKEFGMHYGYKLKEFDVPNFVRNERLKPMQYKQMKATQNKKAVAAFTALMLVSMGAAYLDI